MIKQIRVKSKECNKTCVIKFDGFKLPMSLLGWMNSICKYEVTNSRVIQPGEKVFSVGSLDMLEVGLTKLNVRYPKKTYHVKWNIVASVPIPRYLGLTSIEEGYGDYYFFHFDGKSSEIEINFGEFVKKYLSSVNVIHHDIAKSGHYYVATSDMIEFKESSSEIEISKKTVIEDTVLVKAEY